jgi:6-phosphogluconate dehydrogenase
MSYGLIGLGTMGSNLALNISKKHKLHLYNRSSSKIDVAINSSMKRYQTVLQMTQSMSRPRTLIIMLPHGEPSNEMISHTLKLLDPGDTIIDCANEHYTQSSLRQNMCDKYQVNFLGTGISSYFNSSAVMIGGKANVYKQQKEFFNDFCKSVVHIKDSPDSGHFCKMVHNGIEHVMLQAIADMYAYFNYNYDFTSAVLRRCSHESSDMNGYLIHSAFNVLDNSNGTYNMDTISDIAQMNDTGLWCVEYAYKHNISIPTIHSAVQSRIASKLPKSSTSQRENSQMDLDVAYNTLRLVFATAVYEGLQLIKHKQIDQDKAQCAWSDTTIIECPMMTYNNEKLVSITNESIAKARLFLLECVRNGVPVPSVSAAVQHHDFIHQHKTQMNLVMAQGHYFGTNLFH